MRRTITKILLATGLLAVSNMLCAQVIPFSMEEEAAQQNTPEGWTAVRLPQNLPTLTEQNTFYITSYGATTTSENNTTAIQNALDAAVNAGGGMVVVPAGEWMFGRIQIGSKTILHLCAGATLKVLPYASQAHTLKTPYISNKSGACDIVIEGEGNTSIIEGQGGPWWDAVENKEDGLQRGSLIRFENGNGARFLFRNFKMQNAPSTNLTLGNSGRGGHNTVHNVTIYAPSSHATDPSHNTDGIPIWSAYANIYDCDIDTGDDNVVTDSNAQFIHVWNCRFKAGHGASLGSYTTNMHDIIFEDISFDGTDSGFRLKSNTDRSGDVYNLVFRNCTINNVMNPIQITAWYDTLPTSPATAAASPSDVTPTTPKFHDILIQNVTVSGYNTALSNAKNGYGIFIYGRPESLVKDVTFDNVQIQHGKGLKLNFCEGVSFVNDCSYKNTKTNVSTATSPLADLIEEQYQCSYSWNGQEPPVVLNAVTSTAVVDESTTYTFNGGYSILTNNKKYATGNGNTIKYSIDMDYTITLPEGKSLKAITFKGYGNGKNGEDSYLKAVNGKQYQETDYVFGNRNVITKPEQYASHTITFDQPVSSPVTFQVGGAQACFIITLDVTSGTTGITQVERLVTDNVCYTLSGQRVAHPTKGLYIINGKKVIIK